MEAAVTLPEEMQLLPLGDAGLAGWKIATPHCRALVSIQGAQVLEFQAVGRKPLLWLSDTATYVPGKAIRGGIPLCFPWFGPHPDDPGKPAHGFARTLDWQLAQVERKPEALLLHFRLASSAATRALWPHDFEATLQISLGRVLQLQLEVTNTSAAEFSFGFAFHSYFPVSDIRQVQVEGLDGTPCIDQLNPARTPQTQQGPVRFAGETDRIHLHTGGELCLVDAAVDQAVRISAPACRSAIVWNPGPAKAARLGDMPATAWQHMACVECGNVESDRVSLPPGAAKLFTLQLESEN
ncbi:MAG: D-hexose-6-phosphate mutarotase [Moraxellaceae bacterium]|jgi:glucose-6-phosphate 1-epimerase|nr:D-hexose-6-phosphate mutarotase [Moraxellaceae bacterium]